MLTVQDWLAANCPEINSAVTKYLTSFVTQNLAATPTGSDELAASGVPVCRCRELMYLTDRQTVKSLFIYLFAVYSGSVAQWRVGLPGSVEHWKSGPPGSANTKLLT